MKTEVKSHFYAHTEDWESDNSGSEPGPWGLETDNPWASIHMGCKPLETNSMTAQTQRRPNKGQITVLKALEPLLQAGVTFLDFTIKKIATFTFAQKEKSEIRNS